MVEVKEVKTRKEKKEFLNFPLKLYKNNEYFVPPLYMDEKKIFNKDYIYYDTCDAVYYNAYIDGKIVGRISGILQKASNEKTKEKRIRFTRFDVIDNQEVATALFSAIEQWAKEKGMDTVCGPLGFSDLEREGLLIKGFDQLSTYEEQYNYSYYQKLIENVGYTKEVDWLERKIYPPKENNERLERLCSLMMKRYKLHFASSKNKIDFINTYKDGIFKLIDTTYVDLYGTVPFTEGMKKMIIDNFKLIMNLKFASVILNEQEEVVCFALCLPSIAKAVQKSGGHLTIPTLFKILKSIKKPEILDLGLIGVMPEYANKGIASSFIYELGRILRENNIKYAETNLNLEDNYAILNQWKNFESEEHKVRRSFIKKLN